MAAQMLVQDFFTVLLWLFFLPLSLHMQTDRSYSWLYGNVVGLQLDNVSLDSADISGAIEVARARIEVAFTSEQLLNSSVVHVTKTRLLYSEDGFLPTLMGKRFKREGKEFVQRSQLVVGLLYTFTIVVNHSNSLLVSDPSFYHFTITRDPHKQYHIYQHTSTPYLSNNNIVSPTQLDFVEHYRTTDLVKTCIGDKTSKSSSFHSTCPTVTDEQCLKNNVLLSLLKSWTDLRSFRSVPEPLCTESSHGLNKLTVATYNIWNVNSEEGESYKHRLRRLGKLISSRELDVFGFQEVRLEVGKRPKQTLAQVTQLSSYLPQYQFVYQPAMLFPSHGLKGGRREEGVAVFSKHPIVATDYILLYRNETSDEDRHQRVCLHAAIDVPLIGLVHVFVTHLSLAEEAQTNSVVELWRYMEQFSGPKLLLGDLNAEPHSAPIRFLNGEVSLEGWWSPRLHDLWAATHTEPDGDTGYTFSALSSLVKRIDYIFMQVGADCCGLVDPPVFLCASDAVTEGAGHPCREACSDHLALVATLEVS